jgi:hypothetical protein
MGFSQNAKTRVASTTFWVSKQMWLCACSGSKGNKDFVSLIEKIPLPLVTLLGSSFINNSAMASATTAESQVATSEELPQVFFPHKSAWMRNFTHPSSMTLR